MAVRRIVSERLCVRDFGAADLDRLLEWVTRPGSGSRWVIGDWGEGLKAVWPLDGTVEPVDDPEQFCAARNQIGILLPSDVPRQFMARFPDVADRPVDLMRVAGIVAPFMRDLHPEVRGIRYDMEPSANTRRLINVLGRFLPKGHAIAIQSAVEGGQVGLYVLFNARRQMETIIGLAGWPDQVVAGGPMRRLESLGGSVDVGIRITAHAFRELLEGRLNRQGYAALFRAGDIQLDPLPLAPRLALKAARII